MKTPLEKLVNLIDEETRQIRKNYFASRILTEEESKFLYITTKTCELIKALQTPKNK